MTQFGPEYCGGQHREGRSWVEFIHSPIVTYADKGLPAGRFRKASRAAVPAFRPEFFGLLHGLPQKSQSSRQDSQGSHKIRNSSGFIAASQLDLGGGQKKRVKLLSGKAQRRGSRIEEW